MRLAYSMIFVLGTFGNSVVCIAILKRKGMQTSCNIFTFNLAFHDLILVLVYVPIQMIVFENCYNWVLGDFMCYVVYTILPLSLSVSIGTLLAITADRYRAIVFPVKSKLTKKTVLKILAAIWVVSALTALPLLLVVKVFSPNPGELYCVEVWPSKIASEVYWVAMFAFQYLLPLCIIAVLAGITWYTLRKNSFPAAMETCTQSEVFRKTIRKRVKQTRRIRNMLIALVLLYAVCMLPQHVVFIWVEYGNLSEDYREMANIIANIFPIANSALNAIAYGTLNKEFKAVFNGLFSCVCFKMTARRELFGRHTISGTEMPERKNERGLPLLQEWKNGRGDSLSPVTEMTLKEFKQGDIVDTTSCNQGNNLPSNDDRECLLGKEGARIRKKERIERAGLDDKEIVFEKETVL